MKAFQQPYNNRYASLLKALLLYGNNCVLNLTGCKKVNWPITQLMLARIKRHARTTKLYWPLDQIMTIIGILVCAGLTWFPTEMPTGRSPWFDATWLSGWFWLPVTFGRF